MKILLATGSIANRTFLQNSLAQSSFDLQWVSDGHLASQILLSPGAPRIAILDDTLSVPDSLTLCRQLRARPAQPYIYLLLLASSNSPEVIAPAFTAGFDACLPSPCTSEELTARLRVAQRVLNLKNSLVPNHQLHP